MPKNKNPSSIPNNWPKIIHDDVKLLLFAMDIANPVPLPLRRTLSLVRDVGFKTIIVEQSRWPNEQCNEKNCGLRFRSCKEYVSILKKHYDCELKEKECYKIAVFKSLFETKKELDSVPESDLIAYCILQQDTFQKDPDRSFKNPDPYVTESIIDLTDYHRDGFTFGKCMTKAKIWGRQFQLTGNYFSQQNGVTNCCAHAAIKMAIRGYYPHVTSEKINQEAGIDHRGRNKGNEGLEPKDFIKVIQSVSELKAFLFEARSFETPFHFFKLIYHAIESRFPVILFFTYPAYQEQTPSNRNKQDGHSATLIGYTFNKHTWWGYARKGYFSRKRELEYLPSVMWCDNFVIQDDNVGPAYLLPIHALQISELAAALPNPFKAIIQNLKFKLSSKYEWLYRPLYAIISYPEKLGHFDDILKVEPYANKRLIEYVAYLERENLQPKSNLFYSKYFIPHFEQRSLILRTFSLLKEEYLENFCLEEDKNGLKEALQDSLPNYIWLTEISIPELFWINKKKIGEVITDPYLFHENPIYAVKCIQLPGLFTFFGEKGNIRTFGLQLKDYRLPLIIPKCENCFNDKL